MSANICSQGFGLAKMQPAGRARSAAKPAKPFSLRINRAPPPLDAHTFAARWKELPTINVGSESGHTIAHSRQWSVATPGPATTMNAVAKAVLDGAQAAGFRALAKREEGDGSVNLYLYCEMSDNTLGYAIIALMPGNSGLVKTAVKVDHAEQQAHQWKIQWILLELKECTQCVGRNGVSAAASVDLSAEPAAPLKREREADDTPAREAKRPAPAPAAPPRAAAAPARAGQGDVRICRAPNSRSTCNGFLDTARPAPRPCRKAVQAGTVCVEVKGSSSWNSKAWRYHPQCAFNVMEVADARRLRGRQCRCRARDCPDQ